MPDAQVHPNPMVVFGFDITTQPLAYGARPDDHRGRWRRRLGKEMNRGAHEFARRALHGTVIISKTNIVTNQMGTNGILRCRAPDLEIEVQRAPADGHERPAEH